MSFILHPRKVLNPLSKTMYNHNFRKLDIWRDGIELADLVYAITDMFPKEERYGISSQMQRAAVSVPSNIAEGSAKESTKEVAHFLGIALGSLFELETQIEIVHNRGYIEDEQYYLLLTKVQSLQKRVYTFKQKLLSTMELNTTTDGN